MIGLEEIVFVVKVVFTDFLLTIVIESILN